MEVGAVKQAYNNEVILLKKKLNQAKIQIIHKLTRKAKTLMEKKVPDKLKEKFTKKAESAVKEVLILKKIKARDVAKFIVTHKGQLNEYMNRPAVDQNKACARLLLHKALQDKYKVIRERFSNISIEDLLMSRQERRKLKKEAQEKQKNNNKKSKNANYPVQAEGHWNVAVIQPDDGQLNVSDNDIESLVDKYDPVDDKGGDESENDNNDLQNNNIGGDVDSFDEDCSESNDEDKLDDQHRNDNSSIDYNQSDNSGNDNSAGKFVNFTSCLGAEKTNVDNKSSIDIIKTNEKVNKKQAEKKCKDSNKNKNYKNKILLKKFNKEKSEVQLIENKVVDPFFITATGENYMSVSEPRPPDEVKEVHKQGNRKYRRAVMFGNIPKAKPRRSDFRFDNNNSRFSKFENGNNDGKFSTSFKTNGLEPEKGFNKSVDSSNKGNFKDRKSEKNNFTSEESKPEKLHPSWEAKKRQSGILPFQGKKIVFDEG